MLSSQKQNPKSNHESEEKSMITFLDLLIIVSMVLIAGSLLSVALMFLVKNRKVRQVCLWITAVLGLYVGSVGIRINWPDFYGQAVLAAVFALTGVAALVLALVRRENEKVFLAARIAAAAALVLGVVNALMV